MKVILISGKSASGKDQLAKFLEESLNKNDYRVLVIHYADAVKFFAKTYYNWDGNKDAAGRTLLQYLGTDTVRKKYPEYWADIVGKFISAIESDWDFVLIPDWRFINEYEITKQYNPNTITIRINRLNNDGTYYLNPAFLPSQNQHISECELDDYYFDYIVDNSGTLEQLKELSNILIREIC